VRARRTDGNKQALHKLWLAIGGSWLDIAPDHGGEPDALIGWRGKDALIEVKRPNASKARKNQPNQVEWRAKWRGRPVAVVECFDDLREIFNER
jgi:hypothetical protein